jgi:hypothetical protein
MNRFAPGWLPRQQRRRIDRELDKLIQRDVCSLCGAPFKHNTRTAPGLADQLLAGIERRGDGIRASEVNLQDYAWKRDDARWFEQNPGRTHRALTLDTLIKKYQASGAAS